MISFKPAPKGAFISDEYEVFVRDTNSNWQKLSVYIALTHDGDTNSRSLPEEYQKTYDGLTYGTLGVKTYFVDFSFSGVIQVKVIFKKSFDRVKIKPESYGVNFEENGKEILINLDKPIKLSIEPDGDIFAALRLFANPIEKIDFSDYDNIIDFPEGLHDCNNSKHISLNSHGVPVISGVTDNTIIHISEGAVVRAVAEINGLKHVKICGRGILSGLDRAYGAYNNFTVPPFWGGFRYHALPSVYIHAKSENVIIEDVTIISEFRGIGLRNTRNIKINNVKNFSYCVNGDGINGVNSSNVYVTDCYLQNADDNFCFYTSYDSIPTLVDEPENMFPPVSENNHMSNCILWTSCRPFMFGGHGTGETMPHNRVENISVSDCEIISVAFNIYGNTYKHNYYWSGIFRILSQSEQIVKNILLQNINVEWTKGYTGKPLHFEVRSSETASYSECKGYRIEGITLRNIHFHGCPQDRMNSVIKSIESETEGEGIYNVRIENMTFDQAPAKVEDFEISGATQNIIV